MTCRPSARDDRWLAVLICVVGLVASCGDGGRDRGLVESTASTDSVLGEIEWRAFVEQNPSGKLACVSVYMSEPPLCNGGIELEGMDLASIPEAERPPDLEGFYYLRDVYLEASVRREGDHLVLTVSDYDLDGRTPQRRVIECDPGIAPDRPGALSAFFELNARVNDPNITISSGESGVLRVQTLVTTPEVVDQVCDLAEIPISIRPLAHTVNSSGN